jgi:N-methylhydantoinase A
MGLRVSVGVDIGGTFTDAVLVDGAGQVTHSKVPSTPPDFHSGLVEAIRGLNHPLSDIALVSHGTTVGVNAIVSRRGARTALVTTRGFRDTLALRRGNRASQFDLWWNPVPALVPRLHRFEVDERIDYAGKVIVPLEHAAVRALARRLARFDFDAVAIVLINSFVNPAHERDLRDLLASELPDVYVSVSHEILREIREYERTSTTTINAYIGPVMAQYVSRLEDELKEHGYQNGVVIATSTGGVTTPEVVRRVPARTVESGPAAGVMAAREIARVAGYENVVTFDMGGTSLDVGLIADGTVRRSSHYMIEWGTPIHFPCIDVFSIGAGGGSVAWIDSGGALRNGPQSAGARPGPACYGAGGAEPTNTDAQLVLGRLDPAAFLGGAMTIYPDLARTAIQSIADRLDMTTEEAAEGIVAIANNNMLHSLRLATVERGYDPRDFCLFALGGAGPLYAAEVAAAAQIPTVIVPRRPGLTSAFGLLLIDIRHDVSRSLLATVEDDYGAMLGDMNAVYEELESEVLGLLAAENILPAQRILQREADLRYFGQSEAITVSVPSGLLEARELEAVLAAFEAAQLREFGYTMSAAVSRIEIATLRVAGIGSVDKAPLANLGRIRAGATGVAPPVSRSVWFGNVEYDTAIYQRDALPAGFEFAGPAIVEQADSTVPIPPSMRARVDDYGNIVIDVNASL